MTSRGNKPKAKKVFTTGDLAVICHVAPRTISKLFDGGWIRGYRVPGGNDRRIPRESVIRFLNERQIPIPPGWGLETRPVVLLVGTEGYASRLGVLAAMLPLCWITAPSPFEAGMAMWEHHPRVVVLDMAMGPFEVAPTLGSLRAMPPGQRPHLVALTTDDNDCSARLLDAGCDHVFVRPFDPAELIEYVREVIDLPPERQSA